MKKNYILLTAYMIIMGAGLFICNHFLNTPYNSTEFSRKFLPFMFILAVLVLYYGIKNKNELTLHSESRVMYFQHLCSYLWSGLDYIQLSQDLVLI